MTKQTFDEKDTEILSIFDNIKYKGFKNSILKGEDTLKMTYENSSKGYKQEILDIKRDLNQKLSEYYTPGTNFYDRWLADLELIVFYDDVYLVPNSSVENYKSVNASLIHKVTKKVEKLGYLTDRASEYEPDGLLIARKVKAIKQKNLANKINITQEFDLEPITDNKGLMDELLNPDLNPFAIITQKDGIFESKFLREPRRYIIFDAGIDLGIRHKEFPVLRVSKYLEMEAGK